MDSEIVKTIHLEKDESLFEAIEYRLERKGEYSATELNIESAVDILKTMKGTMYEREARKILKTISQWRAFCIYHNSSLDIKFLHADPTMRDMLPRGRMFLFSATRLRTEELQFYCNIPRNMCDMVGTTHEAFSPKKNVTYYYITCNLDSDKENITRSMLAGTNIRTLMLFNNNSTCQIWGRALSSGIKDRIMVIPSGLDYRDRTKLFNSFLERDNAILLTSSSVYWEGINIKNLRLLIIPYSPFPQPSILEISQGRQTDYKGIAKRRLIQGLGRIGRSPQDSGICLMLFDPEISWDRVTRVPVGEAKAFVTGLTTVDA
jgi:hypothetical protein